MRRQDTIAGKLKFDMLTYREAMNVVGTLVAQRHGNERTIQHCEKQRIELENLRLRQRIEELENKLDVRDGDSDAGNRTCNKT